MKPFAELQFKECDNCIDIPVRDARAADFIENDRGIDIQTDRLTFLRSKQKRRIKLYCPGTVNREHDSAAKKIIARLFYFIGNGSQSVVNLIVDQHGY